MQQYYPEYRQNVVKNKPASASLVLSIISLALLVWMIPLMFVGGMLMSMGGQSPQASGVDLDDPVAIEEYFRASRNLGIAGIIVMASAPVFSGITGILGLIFGIIGVRKPGKKGQAIAGIVMSSIPICLGAGFILVSMFN